MPDEFGALSRVAADGSHLVVSSIAFPITVLGHGCRAGLWVQGCTIGCRGCASRDTWDPADGARVPVTTVAEQLERSLVLPSCDGLTVSGGEPLEQVPGLVALLGRLRPQLRPDQDVLLFTGRPFEYLAAHHGDLIEVLDAVVAGPYRQDDPGELRWRSSANQQLHLLSERGERRYEPYLTSPAQRSLQLVEDGNNVTVIGLPRPGDMDLLAGELAQQGIVMSQRSWSTPVSGTAGKEST